MHRVTRLFVMMGMAAPAATPAAAQDDVDEAFLPLLAVMEHRAIIGDGAPFSLCALYETLGRPDAFLARLDSSVRYLDHQDLRSCEEPRAPAAVEPTVCRRMVSVLEYLVGVSSSFIVVRISADESELSYSEDYRLRENSRSGIWGVEEVRLHSWAYELKKDLCKPS